MSIVWIPDNKHWDLHELVKQNEQDIDKSSTIPTNSNRIYNLKI